MFVLSNFLMDDLASVKLDNKFPFNKKKKSHKKMNISNTSSEPTKLNKVFYCKFTECCYQLNSPSGNGIW